MTSPEGDVIRNPLALIGNTPLLPLSKVTAGLDRTVWVKLESRNLGGSVKDRPALFMIEQAERDGRLGKDGRIVEATSGNTGIALAQIAVLKGYAITIVMPEGVSGERVSHLKALGAEVLLTPSREGMVGAIGKATEMEKSEKGLFMPRQFENPSNPESHYRTTGPEIFRQLGRVPDGFVAGVGTGGTISGVGRYLREKKGISRYGHLNQPLPQSFQGGLLVLTGYRESVPVLSRGHLIDLLLIGLRRSQIVKQLIWPDVSLRKRG